MNMVVKTILEKPLKYCTDVDLRIGSIIRNYTPEQQETFMRGFIEACYLMKEKQELLIKQLEEKQNEMEK